METLHSDILVVGAGVGGTAAAIAAAESGATVRLLEETDWLGGQLTTQGVSAPDEPHTIEQFGATRRYYEFREAVRRYYRDHYRLTAEAAGRPDLNPGSCWVSRLSFEPKVGLYVLRRTLGAFERTGALAVHYGVRPTGCELRDEAEVAAVLTVDRDGRARRCTASYFLDATDLGDLLPMCGAEGEDWVVGAESGEETGEPDAPQRPRRDWIQPFTFPFGIDWSPETAASNVVSPPPDYADLRAIQAYSVRRGAITGMFDGAMPWWTYRRILAAANFEDPAVPSDLILVNTPGNDYYGGNLIGADTGKPGQAQESLARARRAALGYLYWLQTECQREDDPSGRRGYPEFRLRPDVFDTPDGCSIRPYIRESRRIRAARPILEQEIVARTFSGETCRAGARAAFMPDSVGIGHYALDIHPNGHGEPNAFVATRPFQIPLGALIPVRLRNLLPASKNIGVTHLTNGAYRLHPIEWNIGEAAALLAAFCIRHGCEPHSVRENPDRMRAFQETLLDAGIPLFWFTDVPLDHPAFKPVQMQAVSGVALGTDEDLLFRPADPVTAAEWQAWRAGRSRSEPAHPGGTRAEAIRALPGA